ncbi:MAG: hypothetical protein RTU09_04610 [Candidatus Thorarchaeota archaeon]
MPALSNGPANVLIEASVPQKAAQTFTSANILVDEYHCRNASDMWTPGNASMFGWLLMEHGYNVSNNWDAPLDSGILDDYDVLCLFFSMIPLTAGEVTAVHDFVNAGGGLLMVGVDYTLAGWQYTAANLNPISETYGITFNEDRWLGNVLESEGQIVDHHLTFDTSSFNSDCDNLKGCTITVGSPATSIAINHKDEDVLAIAESGSGRVVAVGSAAPFIIYRHGASWQVEPDDHFQLSLNIIDWLTGNGERKVDPPEKAIIRVGSGPSLNSSEIEEYDVFNGVYHDHTTYSDGRDTPLNMMIRSLEVALDFFIVTDHSYDRDAGNGIYGGLKVKEFADLYDADCSIFVGAELSSVPHTVGFPLYEQIITTDTQEAVDGIHSQGAMAVFAHPTISPSYAPVWEAFDDYGYDSFEVDNTGYFHALGESCYFRPFMAGNDGHSVPNHGLIRNVIFVETPSGPDGTLSAQDIIDAVMDMRVVVLDMVNGLVFGQGVWVDRYLQLWDEAEIAIENARTQIEQLEDEGTNVGLSSIYLSDAENSLAWWNPSRALRAVADAVSESVLGLDLALAAPSLGLVDPNSNVNVTINLTNRLDVDVQFNATPFGYTSLVFDESSTLVQAGLESTSTTPITATTTSFGYTKVIFNLKDFNTPVEPHPVILTVGGLILNVTVDTEDEDEGYFIRIRLLRNNLDARMISSAIIQYDNGTGEDTIPLENYGDSYGVLFGPFTTNMTTISYMINVTDILGNVFTIEGVVNEGAPVPPPVDIWPSILIGGGLVAVLVVALVIAKRRK